MVRARWVAATACVLASVVLLAATGTARWLDRVLLEADTWTATVGPLVEQPAVLDTVADELTDLVLSRAAVDSGLDRLLGDRSGPLADAIRDLVPGAIDQLRDRLRGAIRRQLDRPQAADLWLSATERGHRALVAALREEPGPLAARGDRLVVDLGAVLRLVESELVAQGYAIARLLPDDLDRSVTVLRSDAIPLAQASLGRLDRLRTPLPWLAAAVALAALALAPRRVPVALALGVAVAVGLAIPRLADAQLAGRLDPSDAGPPTSIGELDQTLLELARSLDGATRALESAVWIAVLVAALAALGALVVVARDARREQSGPPAAHDLPAGPTTRDERL